MGLLDNFFGKKSEKKEEVTEKNNNANNMGKEIKFKIDGKECIGKEGQLLLDAASENGVYIPSLCHMKGVHPAGSCRICTVKMNGRIMAACTTPLADDGKGIVIESNTAEINDMRKAIVEALFVEGNHFCPSCEKSGDCELQALGYRFQMMVPRFPYSFPQKKVDASSNKLIMEKNRCILCKKCIRTIKDDQGRSIFAYKKRGNKLEINIDKKLSANISDSLAKQAMDNCPVGAIIKKEIGFSTPIGKHKYDKQPIGSNIEK